MFSKKAGFTLIELMLVIVIIGTLAALAVPQLAGRAEQSRIVAARADIESNLSVALDLFETDNGFYPTTEQGLSALISSPTSPPAPPNWRGPYLKKKAIPTDPWGSFYNYACPGTHNSESYDLSSYGRDGVEGNDDDVTNWGD